MCTNKVVEEGLDLGIEGGVETSDLPPYKRQHQHQHQHQQLLQQQQQQPLGIEGGTETRDLPGNKELRRSCSMVLPCGPTSDNMTFNAPNSVQINYKL